MTVMTAEYFNTSLQRLIDQCEQASYLLEQSGSIPDLTGMDADVDKLCSAIQGSDPAIARATETKMARLITSLEKLSFSISNYKNRFTNGT